MEATYYHSQGGAGQDFAEHADVTLDDFTAESEIAQPVPQPSQNEVDAVVDIVSSGNSLASFQREGEPDSRSLRRRARTSIAQLVLFRGPALRWAAAPAIAFAVGLLLAVWQFAKLDRRSPADERAAVPPNETTAPATPGTVRAPATPPSPSAMTPSVAAPQRIEATTGASLSAVNAPSRAESLGRSDRPG